MTAVILTSELIRDYLLNYARSLIYTTSLSYASAIAINCSIDLLEDGTTEKVKFTVPSVMLKVYKSLAALGKGPRSLVVLRFILPLETRIHTVLGPPITPRPSRK